MHIKYSICFFALLLAFPAHATKYELLASGNPTGDIREFGAMTPPDISHKGFEWRRSVIVKPDLDRTTQVRTGPVVTLQADTVTRTWTVRQKTQAELDTDAENDATNNISVGTYRLTLFEHAFLLENRVRVLEGKSPITKSVFRNALKALYKSLR